MGSASAFVIRWINFFTMVSQSVSRLGPLLHPSFAPLLPSPIRGGVLLSLGLCLRPILDSCCPAFARQFFIWSVFFHREKKNSCLVTSSCSERTSKSSEFVPGSAAVLGFIISTSNWGFWLHYPGLIAEVHFPQHLFYF